MLAVQVAIIIAHANNAHLDILEMFQLLGLPYAYLCVIIASILMELNALIAFRDALFVIVPLIVMLADLGIY